VHYWKKTGALAHAGKDIHLIKPVFRSNATMRNTEARVREVGVVTAFDNKDLGYRSFAAVGGDSRPKAVTMPASLTMASYSPFRKPPMMGTAEEI
jgi:hypothetical protein